MEFRRLIDDDLNQIIELQNRNLVNILSPSQQREGFLSTQFTAQDFRGMNESIAIVVCAEDDKILGYLASSKLEFNMQFPTQAELIKRANELIFEGTPVTAQRTFFSGPLCVDQNSRRQGILLGLEQKMLKLVRKEYELALTIISTANLHSYRTLTKIGFIPLDQLEVNSQSFWIAVRKLLHS